MAQGVVKGSSYQIRAIYLYSDCSLSERDDKWLSHDADDYLADKIFVAGKGRQ